MNRNTWKSNFCMLLAAAIWGFAFVAQRNSAQYIGTFTLNGIRFALGAVSLLPLLAVRRRARVKAAGRPVQGQNSRELLTASILCGLVLFAAAALQQVGLADTAAGKTAFITGLYIVLVPILGLAVKQRIGKNAWLGAAIAVAGLYFLCVTSSFTVSAYDLLILGGAFFFAVHILLIDYYAQRVDLIKLAFGQNLTCAAVSLLLAALTESVSMASLRQALIPILYCGILSVGVAYTLQIIGQRDTNPASAALILSSETLFALLGGFLLLDERLDGRGALGILLMLAGIICSQLPARFAGSRQTESKTRKVQAEQLEKI